MRLARKKRPRVSHGEIEKSQAFKVDIEDGHVRAETSGHTRGIHPGGPTAEHDDASRQYPGNAAEQDTAAANMLRQIIRTHHGGHAASDFTHRLEQWQSIPNLNRFVSDGGDAGF